MTKVAHVAKTDAHGAQAGAPPFIGRGHKKIELDDVPVQMLKLSPAASRIAGAINDLTETGGQFNAAAYSVSPKPLASILHSKPGLVRFAYDALARANGDDSKGSLAKQMKIGPRNVELSEIAAKGPALAAEALAMLQGDVQATSGNPDAAQRTRLEADLKQLIGSMLSGAGAKVYRFKEKSENERFAAGILAFEPATGHVRVLSSL